MEQSGKQYIQQVTREDALAYLADQLQKCQQSTVFNEIRQFARKLARYLTC